MKKNANKTTSLLFVIGFLMTLSSCSLLTPVKIHLQHIFSRKQTVKSTNTNRIENFLTDLKNLQVDSVLEFNCNSGFGLSTEVYTRIYWKKKKIGYSKNFYFELQNNELVAVESLERKCNWNQLIDIIDSLRLDTVVSNPARLSNNNPDEHSFGYKIFFPKWTMEFSDNALRDDDKGHPKAKFLNFVKAFNKN